MVEDKVQAAELIKAVKGVDKVLIADAAVFDVYKLDGGKKSLAVEVTLQPREKTFTDADIEAISAKIVATVQKAPAGTLRTACGVGDDTQQTATALAELKAHRTRRRSSTCARCLRRTPSALRISRPGPMTCCWIIPNARVSAKTMKLLLALAKAAEVEASAMP